MQILTRDVYDFFIKLIRDAIQIRESQGIVRPDMINLMIEARKGKKTDDGSSEVIDTGFATVQESAIHTSVMKPKQELTDDDIAAQAMIFFFAGFESVSTLMSFMAHELVVNPEIQKRLQDEIDTTLNECKGKLTYEALVKMKYMDMIVSGIYFIYKFSFSKTKLRNFQKLCVNGLQPLLLTVCAPNHTP